MQIVETLTIDPRFYPGFKRHPLYLKMLQQLGISDDNADELSIGDGESKSTSSFDSDEVFKRAELSSGEDEDQLHTGSAVATEVTSEQRRTTVLIETLGIGRQGKQMFALYNVRVTRLDSSGKNTSSWNIIRRYSDFHTLYHSIITKVLSCHSQIKFTFLKLLVPQSEDSWFSG